MRTSTRERTQRKRASLPPGSLVYVGELAEGPARLRAVIYDRDNVEKRVVATDRIPMPDPASVMWLQVEGVHDIDTVQNIGDLYGLHMLTLEDIVNTEHRAKLEEYDDAVFLILKHMRLNANGLLEEENISLVLKTDAVLSFSAHRQEMFDPNRDRIEAANGRFRARGADYLFYTLIDSVVDGYVSIIEAFEDRLEELEDEVLLRPTQACVQRLHTLRRSMLHLRRAALPLRESVTQLLRNEDALLGSEVVLFLRDVHDHVATVLDSIDHDRELLGSLLELYMTHESNKMNEVMKVLTIIATIFIPLTFVAGVYGMNFRYMPELEQPWGYPAVLLLMLGMTIGLLLFFRRKRWF